jgi:hypothetical protein
MSEIKKNYTFNDLTSFSSEIDRDFFYNSLNSTRLDSIDKLNQFFSTLSAPYLTNFINYLCDTTLTPTTSFNSDLYKNQFRPMRKGISNMIRLHATGAIAMPTEIRLHLLASSRDIIHSWAIPSAGIKIDCIPGYSSHRVAIFLVSGVY